MKSFFSSSLVGTMAKAVAGEPDIRDAPPAFGCLCSSAHTTECNTAFGGITGQIGLPMRDEFRSALHSLVRESTSKVILDLSEAALTRTAAGVLIGFAASMQGRNKRLYLYRPSPQIRAVLKELDLGAFFSYLETEDDILATLQV